MEETSPCGCSIRRSYQRCTTDGERVIPAFADAASAVCFHVCPALRAEMITSFTSVGNLSMRSGCLQRRGSPKRGTR